MHIFFIIFQLFLDIDIKKHKILFEDIKLKDEKQQITYSGTPFVILGKKSLDCTHGTDHGKSKKAKRLEEKLINKVSCSYWLNLLIFSVSVSVFCRKILINEHDLYTISFHRFVDLIILKDEK